MSESGKSKEALLTELGEARNRVGELEAALAVQGHAVDQLIDPDERFRKIFDHSNDGIFLVDLMADEILDVNDKAGSMLGYTREELRSVPMSIIHPHEMDRMMAFAESVVSQGKGWTDELSCMTKSGMVVPTEISASIVEVAGKKCMVAMVRDISARNRLSREKQILLDEIHTERRFGAIIGRSAAMNMILEQVKMVAPTDAAVLIMGESGTGKELVARAIHEESTRKESPLVRVNCASIPGELFESEFFGHVRGAFTGATRDRDGRFHMADGGTIFLDEIGEIPIQLQSKLLRVLQEGQFERIGESRARQVDVRIIAATNRDLVEETKKGGFRQDLYYRLSVFPITIAPLRERPEDIAPLADHFVKDSCARLKVPAAHLGIMQLRTLESYSWPGNVRELQNVIERAIILNPGGELHFDLGDPVISASSSIAGEADPSTTQSSHSSTAGEAHPSVKITDLTLAEIERLERDVILRALNKADWKISGADGAAALLKMKPTTLTSRVQRMGLKKPDA